MPQAWSILPCQGSDPEDEWVRLGVQAHCENKLPDAQAKYNHALRLNPRHAIATHNLAILFAQSPGFLNEALLTIERAELMDGVLHQIAMNYAYIAMEAERIDVAIEKARKAVEMKRDQETLFALASMCPSAGLADEAVRLHNEVLDLNPKHPMSAINACFVQTLTDATPADLLKQRQRWYKANRYEGKIEPHDNDRTVGRTLRIGYVGGDFKSHSASFIFSHVLFHHTEAVEMYLYSSLPVDENADPKTKKFKELAGERWRDISTMSDDDAARMIRRDKIDILVDLAAHTNGGRLRIFTFKPAPVQVTAWGFAHGTGLTEIDYFFADPIAIPEHERKDYAEKIYDLPCIVTMEPNPDYNLKAYSSPPLRRNGYLTLGNYARYEKVSDKCLRTYAEIMRRIPDARMQWKDAAFRRPFSIKRIMSFMPDVAPERLLFSQATSHYDHLLAMQQADIQLDPYPHGGGAVTLEELWMGAPLVTRYGTQPAGRTAASVLTAMGRKEWVAKDEDEYVEIVVKMSENPKAMADARTTLREEFLKSPVVSGYVEKVEEAYANIWKVWCKS